MSAKNTTEKMPAWKKPVIYAAMIGAALGLLGFAGTEVYSSIAKYADNAVRENNQENNIAQALRNDTIHCKQIKSIELVINEFVQEVRNDRSKDILINNLQTQQINTLAKKVKAEKDIEELKKNYEILKEQLEDQTYRKNRENMLIPEGFDTTFGESTQPVGVISIEEFNEIFNQNPEIK